MAALDGIGERSLVNQLAARGIDDAEPLLALREALRIEEVPGRGQRGHVQRDVIGARAQIVERDELHAKRRRHFCRDEGIVRDHLHLECVRPSRHFLSDAAKSDQSEGL